MTHAQTPLTFPAAVNRIVDCITAQGAADAVGKRVSLIYAWQHPTGQKRPNIEQARALDAAHMLAGGDGAPILETYAQLLDVDVAQQIACRTALIREIGDAAREHGQALAAAIAFAQPNAGDRELHRAIGEVEDAHGAMAVLLRRLMSFLRPARGRDEENRGGAQ